MDRVTCLVLDIIIVVSRLHSELCDAPFPPFLSSLDVTYLTSIHT